MSDESDTIVVRGAGRNDWEGIRRLLDEAGLPVADLGPERLEHFLIAEQVVKNRSHTLGTIGLQPFNRVGLLRSLAVDERNRSAGLGKRLVSALEANACCAGVEELWLLTIDAERYFEALGYRLMSRDSAPDSIRQTEEFAGLCPDGAFLMKKALK